MPESPVVDNQSPPEKRSMPTWLRIVVSLVGLFLFVAAWFAVAGRIDWVQGWAFIAVFAVYTSVLVWRLSRIDPDLMRERQRTAENVEPWDRILMSCYLVLLLVLLALLAVDGGRFHWSRVPLYVQLLGWGALCVAGAIVWHVMGVNAYLSSYARIQDDRGQVVVTQGLYGRVRHPMYLGIIVAFGGLPLALGSWWSLIPSFLIGLLFVYRTAREDQMLREKLDGYQEYAAQVPYRLLPGVW